MLNFAFIMLNLIRMLYNKVFSRSGLILVLLSMVTSRLTRVDKLDKHHDVFMMQIIGSYELLVAKILVLLWSFGEKLLLAYIPKSNRIPNRIRIFLLVEILV